MSKRRFTSRLSTTLGHWGLVCCCAMPLAAQQVNPSKWGKNTAGVELTVREQPRQHTSSGTDLMYNLIGKGYPAEKSYDLWFWTVGKQPEKAISGASFDKRGVLVCSGKPGSCPGKGFDDPINVKATAVLGEIKRFAVISSDGHIAGFAETVPFPIEAQDKNCKLSVIRADPLADTVAVRANGFTPYEMLDVKMKIGSQDSAHSPTASSDGSWQAMIGTKSPGQTSGTAMINVSDKSCSVSVNFDWGEGSNKQQ